MRGLLAETSRTCGPRSTITPERATTVASYVLSCRPRGKPVTIGSPDQRLRPCSTFAGVHAKRRSFTAVRTRVSACKQIDGRSATWLALFCLACIPAHEPQPSPALRSSAVKAGLTSISITAFSTDSRKVGERPRSASRPFQSHLASWHICNVGKPRVWFGAMSSSGMASRLNQSRPPSRAQQSSLALAPT